MTELLTELLQKLDGSAHRFHTLNLYARGEQPLAFLSPESKAALNHRFGKIVSNIPKLAVTSLAERLRVSGFQGVDVWPDFIGNDLDQQSLILHKEALTLGQAFCIVWADAQGNPAVTVESAEQVVVKRDPATRRVVAALKRVRTKKTTEVWVYEADQITHYRADSAGASAGFYPVESLTNPLGVVPVIPFTNADRLLDEDGVSEVEDLKSLCDALNKALADALVAMEFTARPRRWATGIELVEVPVVDEQGKPVLDSEGQPVVRVENPIPEGSRAIIGESPDARFGQLEGADLQGFRTIIEAFTSQIMATASLPSHYLGVLTAQPASADALRASEAALTAKAEARQMTFGRSWEAVARLMYAIRNGVDPETVTARVVWADASTRSIGQEADAALKLFQAGLLSRAGVLKRLGYTQDEIEAELAQNLNEIRDMADAKSDPIMADYLART